MKTKGNTKLEKSKYELLFIDDNLAKTTENTIKNKKVPILFTHTILSTKEIAKINEFIEQAKELGSECEIMGIFTIPESMYHIVKYEKCAFYVIYCHPKFGEEVGLITNEQGIEKIPKPKEYRDIMSEMFKIYSE